MFQKKTSKFQSVYEYPGVVEDAETGMTYEFNNMVPLEIHSVTDDFAIYTMDKNYHTNDWMIERFQFNIYSSDNDFPDSLDVLGDKVSYRMFLYYQF